MNIFVLHTNPKKAAQYHHDKHVVKMILESAQMLCSVHWVNDSEAPYKLAHKNHPCSIWARECKENYLWLCELGLELSKEYTYRYGKVHKSQAIIEWCKNNIPKTLVSKGNITEFAKAMPDECKVDDAVESYRKYYRMYKKTWELNDKKTGEKLIKENVWTNREIPEWLLTD